MISDKTKRVSNCPHCNDDITTYKCFTSLNLRYNGKADWIKCYRCNGVFSLSDGEVYFLKPKLSQDGKFQIVQNGKII